MPDWFDALKTRGLTLATAESCTGGLIAKTVTDRPGASAVLECGFVTYSNRAKTALLGVPAALIAEHGAVSPQTARAMAKGAVENGGADIAVSCTGIAGPDGGTPEKPVGLVHIGICRAGQEPKSYEHRFTGDRAAIRAATVSAALAHIEDELA